MAGEAEQALRKIGDIAATCCTLWIGGSLGPIASACLASFVRHGHAVILYCYDPPPDVPAGVRIADANAVVPSHRIVRHARIGSYALFSNLFRYELFRAGRGIWIDCDVYCVRHMEFDEISVFGWQRANSINGAVLRLPSDSPVLEPLIALFTARSPVPPWLEREEAARLQVRRLAGEEFSVADLPWGSAGPNALTYLLTEAKLTRFAAPPDVFYPLPWDRGRCCCRPGRIFAVG